MPGFKGRVSRKGAQEAQRPQRKGWLMRKKRDAAARKEEKVLD
jgi:hypothetical protein